MKNISKYKLDKSIVIPILLFALISVFTLLGADSILPSTMNNLVSKQIIWYAIGIFLAYIIMTIGNNFIYQIVWILYGIGVLSLAGLFFFGVNINDATCWYQINKSITIQPSEFMKIILIITNATLISKFNEDFLVVF